MIRLHLFPVTRYNGEPLRTRGPKISLERATLLAMTEDDVEYYPAEVAALGYLPNSNEYRNAAKGFADFGRRNGLDKEYDNIKTKDSDYSSWAGSSWKQALSDRINVVADLMEQLEERMAAKPGYEFFLDDEKVIARPRGRRMGDQPKQATQVISPSPNLRLRTRRKIKLKGLAFQPERKSAPSPKPAAEMPQTQRAKRVGSLIVLTGLVLIGGLWSNHVLDNPKARLDHWAKAGNLERLRQSLNQSDHSALRGYTLSLLAKTDPHVYHFASCAEIAAVFCIESPFVLMKDGTCLEPGMNLSIGNLGGYLTEINPRELTLKGAAGDAVIDLPKQAIKNAVFLLPHPIVYYQAQNNAQIILKTLAERQGLTYTGKLNGNIVGYSDAETLEEAILELAPWLGFEVANFELNVLPARYPRGYISFGNEPLDSRLLSLRKLLSIYEGLLGYKIEADENSLDQKVTVAARQLPQLAEDLNLEIAVNHDQKYVSLKEGD